jgi:sugar phosphate isomerase/epimerase
MELEVNDTNFAPGDVEESTLRLIRDLTERGELTFGMHSPGAVNFSDPDPAVREDSVSKVEESLRWAADLGVRVVVVHPGRVVGVFTPEKLALAVDQNVEAIGRCAELAGELGLSLSVENLCHEEGSVNPNIDRFFAMCDRIGLSKIGVTLDTNHAGLVDGLERTIAVVGPYVNYVHFSSNKGERSDHCTPQEGVMDFYASADFFKAFEGMVIIELNERGEESAHAILQTRSYLQELLVNT